MTKEEITLKILEVFRNEFEMENPGLDDDLRESGEFDSVDAIELLLEIDDVTLGSAGLPGLGFETLEFFLLAYVGAERDDLGIILFFDPRQNNRGVETARIC